MDEQIRQGWKEYYIAIGDDRKADAKGIFDRVSALIGKQLQRKTTARAFAKAIASTGRVV